MSTTLTEPRNRYVLIGQSQTVNGIDYVELRSVDATTLYVHFINAVPVATAGLSVSISGGDVIRGIKAGPVTNASWSQDSGGRPLLTVTVNRPGDFSAYTLTIIGGPLDLMYASADFSFKALCQSEFDCAPPAPYCPPDTTSLPAIDYLAKDFKSFKQALTDFSAQRYPSWLERTEADFGVMFMEALCQVGDELSYLQDRVAAEASLRTATQRRSLVSMARLVDYEPLPVVSATTIIQCNVAAGPIAAGAVINAVAPDGSLVPFEVGTGLNDNSTYLVSPSWNDAVSPNGIHPYWFDDSQRCMRRGATSMYVRNHGFNFTSVPNLPLLIQTDLPGGSIREIVHVTGAVELTDPLFPENGQPAQMTQIFWAAADAPQRDHDLTATRLMGNLMPATQGRRHRESFAIGVPPVGFSGARSAIARRGPNGADAQPNWIFRYPLEQTQTASAMATAATGGFSSWGESGGRLAWQTPNGSDPSLSKPVPDILLSEVTPNPRPWSFGTSLLTAGALDTVFTIEPVAWRAVATDDHGVATHWDIDGDQGDTLRFGDDVFGLRPAEGSVFEVRYRTSQGASGNVAPDAIGQVDPAWASYITSARNPFAVTNGADAETPQHIVRMAPQAFRAVQYRAVRPEDYQAAAETLPWVVKAGTAFRWTGSWLTVFTSADPTGDVTASEAQRQQLIDLLNRRRLAGYESYAPSPVLVAIDLQIMVCAVSGWLSGDVEAGVLNRLGSATRPDGSSGFFFADRFTLGTPLYRSRLEAAVQGVPGVNGVLSVQYRRRGDTAVFLDLPEVLSLGAGEILRVENNPDYPARGTIRVFVEGGL